MPPTDAAPPYSLATRKPALLPVTQLLIAFHPSNLLNCVTLFHMGTLPRTELPAGRSHNPLAVSVFSDLNKGIAHSSLDLSERQLICASAMRQLVFVAARRRHCSPHPARPPRDAHSWRACKELRLQV